MTILITLLSLWTGFSAQPGGEEVWILISSEAGPYREAATRLQLRLRERELDSRVSTLESLTRKALEYRVLQGNTAVVSIGSRAARAVQELAVARAIHIYCLVSDPESLGLLDAPVSHGVSIQVPLVQQLVLIEEALPETHQVGLLCRSPASGEGCGGELKAALPAGWEAFPVDMGATPTAAEAIDRLLETRVDVVWMTADSEVFNRATIRALLLGSVRRRVPVFGYSESCVKAGALFGISIEPSDQADQAFDILWELRSRAETSRSEEPALRQDPRFRIVWNENVADLLRVKLPASIRKRAREVHQQ